MKDILKKFGLLIKKIYGVSIMVCLFAGGMTFLGYVIALFIGGPVAEQICVFVYKSIVPVVIYVSSITVLLGLISMYLCGEKALSIKKDKRR